MVLDLPCRSTLVLATTLQHLQLLSSHMQWFNILINSCYLLTWTIEITPNDGLFNAFYIMKPNEVLVFSMQQNLDLLWLPVFWWYIPIYPPKTEAFFSQKTWWHLKNLISFLSSCVFISFFNDLLVFAKTAEAAEFVQIVKHWSV